MASFVQHYGYFALIVLSIVSSACIPIPSEVTFVVAGALCTTALGGTTHLSFWPIVLIGTLGSVIGAQIAYEVGRYGGRAFVERWGKWVLLSHRDLDAAEAWFVRFGPATVLIGRVVPVVRSFVSVPAGVAEMRRGTFATLTAIGSAAWVVLLAALGDAAGRNWSRVSGDVHDAQWPVIAAVVVLFAIAIGHRVRTRRAQER